MTSNESKLYQKIIADTSARAALESVGSKKEFVAAVLQMGEKFGLPVTVEAVQNIFTKENAAALSDAELESVVGGKGNPNETISGDTWAWIGLPDDDLSGGDGNDTLWGFTGNDTLDGGTGDDSLFGGTGNDTMTGGSGDDVIWGEEGNDTMDGGSGADTMRGGEGNDVMDGGQGDDWLYGEAGNDTMSGGAGSDYMEGGSGNDTMRGGSGDDGLDGGSGDDVLHGGSGNDTLAGRAGDDILDGGSGNDWLVGGTGNDTFVFGNNDGNDTISDFNPAQDTLLLEGAEYDDVTVSHDGYSTVLQFGDTTITFYGQDISKDALWESVETE